MSEADEVTLEALPGRFSSLDPEKVPALSRAAAKGSVAKLSALLAARADVGENVCPGHEQYDGLTALHLAAAVGSLECTGLLLQSGASYSAHYTINQYEMEGAGPMAGQLYVVSSQSVCAVDVATSADVRQMLVDARMGYEPMLKVETLSIAVTGMDSTKIELSLPSSATCNDLKAKVAEAFKIALPQVCLISGTLPIPRSQDSASLGAKFSSKVKAERRIDLNLVVRSVSDVMDFWSVEKNGLRDASQAMRGDKEVVMAALQQYPEHIRHVAAELKSDVEVALTVVRKRGRLLEELPGEMRGNKEVVVAACKAFGRALSYASPALKADKDCIGAALQSTSDSDDMERICKEVPVEAIDKDVAFVMVKKHWKLLSHLPEQLRDDKDVVLESLRHTGGSCLSLVSPRLKADWDVVASAVWQSGWSGSMYGADQSLKSSKDFIRFLLQHEVPGLGPALREGRHADLVKTLSEEVRSDKELMRGFIFRGNDLYDPSVISCLPENLRDEFRQDPELAIAAITLDWYESTFQVPSELLSNRDFIKQAMKKHLPRAYLRCRLKSDRDFVEAVFEYVKSPEGQSGMSAGKYNAGTLCRTAYSNSPEDMKANRDLAMFLVKMDGFNYRSLTPAWKVDKEVANAALQDPNYARSACAKDLPPELTGDKDFMLGVLKRDISAFDGYEHAKDYYIDVVLSELLADKDFVMAAIEYSLRPFCERLSEGLKADRDVVTASLRKWQGGHAALDVYLAAPNDLKEDKEIYMLLPFPGDLPVSRICKEVPQRVLDDKDFILALAGYNNMLEFQVDIWEKWKHDRDVVRTVAVSRPAIFREAGDSLREDTAFVIELMTETQGTYPRRQIYEEASERLKKDKGFLREAAKLGGVSLGACPEEFKADKELVLAIVKNDGWELQYASLELRGDEDCARAAVASTVGVLQYVTAAEKLRRELAVLSAGQHGRATLMALKGSQLLGDKEIVLAALRSSSDASLIHLLPKDMKEDQEVLLAWDAARRARD